MRQSICRAINGIEFGCAECASMATSATVASQRWHAGLACGRRVHAGAQLAEKAGHMADVTVEPEWTGEVSLGLLPITDHRDRAQALVDPELCHVCSKLSAIEAAAVRQCVCEFPQCLRVWPATPEASMPETNLTIGRKNDSSWSLRGDLLEDFGGLVFEEMMLTPAPRYCCWHRPFWCAACGARACGFAAGWPLPSPWPR